jgi:competence protein ComEA
LFSGLTLQEQRVLIVLLLVIGLGLAVHSYQAANPGGAVELLQSDGASATGGAAVELSVKSSDSPSPVEQRASRRLNINTASAQQLGSGELYRIGPARAQAIVEYRNVNGPFHSVDEIANVTGIGPKTLAAIRDRITVGDQPANFTDAASTTSLSVAAQRPAGATVVGDFDRRPVTPPPRININTATAEELTQLKGVGPVTAQAIVAYRRANGPFRRPEDLMKVNGIKQKKFDALRQLITVTKD